MNFPASITRQCEDLAQLLGTACLPYLRSSPAPDLNGALESTYIAAFQSDMPIAIEAVKQAAATKSSALLPIDENRSMFAVQLVGTFTEQWFAIGRTNSPPTDAAARMIRVACEATKRQYQIESHDEALLRVEAELGRSYSERQWLRQLNVQRSIRKRCVGHQSKQTLESLRNLIEAEAVAIFVYSDRNADSHGLESMITGKSTWTLEDVRILLQKTQKPQIGDSVVLNNIDFQLQNASLRSCVIVPVGESDPIGFVIALNRRKHSGHSLIHPENEFRSGDAELLHEAAGYLLSDGHSNVHFQESEQLVLGTLRAMSNAIEARDPYTHGHSERVAKVAYEIAVRLQLSEVSCQEIYLSGILHDIGKIGIPDHVLLKPGKLDAQEVEIIQRHPEIGHRILEQLGKLKFALPGVLYHHERVDGEGYPHRLKGDQIPLMARILAVSDAYDAMTSSRVYRNAMHSAKALEILRNGVGTQWDADAVHGALEYFSQRELVLADGGIEQSPISKGDDWRQVSQALRILQL